jgi:hypothetical protein
MSIDRSLIKGETPRIQLILPTPLSSERPFKFPRYLVQSLGIDNIIAITDTHVCKYSKCHILTDADTDTDKDMDKDTDKDKNTDRK